MVTSYMSSMKHPAGTCKMGPKDKTAVVNADLQVRDVRKLRVMDTYIIPVIGRVNINAPTIIIAEVGSNFIKSTTKYFFKVEVMLLDYLFFRREIF